MGPVPGSKVPSSRGHPPRHRTDRRGAVNSYIVSTASSCGTKCILVRRGCLGQVCHGPIGGTFDPACSRLGPENGFIGEFTVVVPLPDGPSGPGGARLHGPRDRRPATCPICSGSGTSRCPTSRRSAARTRRSAKWSRVSTAWASEFRADSPRPPTRTGPSWHTATSLPESVPRWQNSIPATCANSLAWRPASADGSRASLSRPALMRKSAPPIRLCSRNRPIPIKSPGQCDRPRPPRICLTRHSRGSRRRSSTSPASKTCWRPSGVCSHLCTPIVLSSIGRSEASMRTTWPSRLACS